MPIQNKRSDAFRNSVSRLNSDNADHYATPFFVTASLLFHEKVPDIIWEPCSGEGCMSLVLQSFNKTVISTDLHSYPESILPPKEGIDFLTATPDFPFQGIITNPPYMKNFPEKFVRKARTYKCYTAVLCRLAFLEGTSRHKLFTEDPPDIVYIYSGRFSCGKLGFGSNPLRGMTSYAWFVWRGENEHEQKTRIMWLDTKEEYQRYTRDLHHVQVEA